MGKRKNLWWGYVKNILRKYPDEIPEKAKNAVNDAISETAKLPSGAQRLEIIRLVYFDKTHTLEGAAQKVYCAYGTAKEWQQSFMNTVAANMELPE